MTNCLKHYSSTVLLLVAVALLVLAIITKRENQPTTSYKNSVREINHELCGLKLGKAPNCSVEECPDETTRLLGGQCCEIDRIDRKKECCPPNRKMAIRTKTCCLEGQDLSVDQSSCKSNSEELIPEEESNSEEELIPEEESNHNEELIPEEESKHNEELIPEKDPSRLQKTTIIWILLFIIAVICAFLLILYCTRSNDKAAQGVVGAPDKTDEQNIQGLESEYQFQREVDAE